MAPFSWLCRSIVDGSLASTRRSMTYATASDRLRSRVRCSLAAIRACRCRCSPTEKSQRGPARSFPPIPLRIPELALEPDPGEDPDHFLRLRAPGVFLKPRAIPRRCERPELVHPHDRPHRDPARGAPLPNPFLRPEEEHVPSGEDNVVPPVRGGDEAVEEPVGGAGTVDPDLETEGFSRLLASREHNARPAERGENAECVPGTISVVAHSVRLHDVLGGYSGEGRRHADRPAIRLEHEEPLRAKPLVGREHVRDRGAGAYG